MNRRVCIGFTFFEEFPNDLGWSQMRLSSILIHHHRPCQSSRSNQRCRLAQSVRLLRSVPPSAGHWPRLRFLAGLHLGSENHCWQLQAYSAEKVNEKEYNFIFLKVVRVSAKFLMNPLREPRPGYQLTTRCTFCHFNWDNNKNTLYQTPFHITMFPF